MLKYFSVKNFASIYEEISFELDLGKNRVNESNNAIVLFGSNASGKTNILKAISFLFWFIRESFYSLRPNQIIPFETFANNDENTEFYVEFIIKDDLFKYYLVLNKKQVVYEKLEKNRFKKPIYERKEQNVIIARDIDKNVFKDLSLNTSIISFLSKFETQWAKKIYEYKFVSNVSYEGFNEEKDIENIVAEKVIKNDKKAEILDILKIADTEIVDFDFEEINISEKEKEKIIQKLKKDEIIPQKVKEKIISDILNNNPKTLYFYHKLKDGIFKLTFKQESEGTKRLFLKSLDILDVIANGGVCIMDEIDSNLHFMIVEYIIDMFKTSKAQLICAAHSPVTISNFDKYTFWLVEKENGNTILYSANDFEDLKKEFNLETLYKIGRFGAVPKFLKGNNEQETERD